MKSNSQSYSITIKFEENKNCLDRQEHQQGCDIYILPWLYHEMYLQQVQNLHYLNLKINDVI